MFSTSRACKAADADGDGMIDYKDCSHGLDTKMGLNNWVLSRDSPRIGII
jgi:hypothetical protein